MGVEHPFHLLAWISLFPAVLSARAEAAPLVVFAIGDADGRAGEFGFPQDAWRGFARSFPGAITFVAGTSPLTAWPYIHPSTDDTWAGGKPLPFAIRFQAGREAAGRKLFLTIGLADSHPTPSRVSVAVNGKLLPEQLAPRGLGSLAEDPQRVGSPSSLVFPIEPGGIAEGENEVSITLRGGSWIIYDFLRLSSEAGSPPTDLLDEEAEKALAAAGEIVFAVRQSGKDGHWYANFSYYAEGRGRKAYGEGGRLAKLDPATGKVSVLLEDPRGTIRDPEVDYDGKTVLFSYRPGGDESFHLHEIRADGSDLRRITDGPYDDIEPAYLPDGGLVFLSSRCRRWVNCWLTQVAVLHRMDRDGSNLRPISANIEHDNTPAVLPDGRILYTRWEYVDRSQVDYHHLWTLNPDGTGQSVFYGNLHPGTLMIDARPIPGTDRVVSIFSPGHGACEHEGLVTVVDPGAGPDDRSRARTVHPQGNFRDPYPLSAGCFLAARGAELVAMDSRGHLRTLFALGESDRRAGLMCHEPRPLRPRPREAVIPARSDPRRETGLLVLDDVYRGRSMAGVKRGEIKKLLVLESLPKPINFTGGMEPLSYGGTFTLERVLGTVPVEADGSACFTVPALRSLLFVALDGDDLSVKRMQSFVTVQPGEVSGCVGCHEERTSAVPRSGALLALRRPPSRIDPVAGVPGVLDFPRDIQPILDRRCVPCHGYEPSEKGGPRAGGAILTGDRGPLFSQSYFTLSALRQIADGRNLPRSNYPPRALGSSASPLMKKVDGSHHGASLEEGERRTVRLWIDSGAPYPGTYAALGSGMIGGYRENSLDRSDLEWPSVQAAREVLRGRCGSCHRGAIALPSSPSDDMDMPPWDIRYGDPRLRFSRHILYNLSRPEKSLLLLAPLSRDAGGFGICGSGAAGPAAAVFESAADPDHGKLLASIVDARRRLEEIKRFDMPGFRPPEGYLREMARYGIVPPGAGRTGPLDPYAVDRAYWDSLAWRGSPK